MAWCRMRGRDVDWVRFDVDLHWSDVGWDWGAVRGGEEPLGLAEGLKGQRRRRCLGVGDAVGWARRWWDGGVDGGGGIGDNLGVSVLAGFLRNYADMRQ